MSLAEALQAFVQTSGWQQRLSEQRAVGVWADCVGLEIARVTQAEAVREGVLQVRVLRSAWKTELNYLKEEIIAKLNEALGDKVVTDIRFY